MDNIDVKTTLAEKIAGEIALSPKPGQTIKKWREIFNISQTELAQNLDLSPSVICDYQSGRRKSPGIQVVKKFVGAFLDIDEKRNNSETLRRYQPFVRKDEGILEIMDCVLHAQITIVNKRLINSIIFFIIINIQSDALQKKINLYPIKLSAKNMQSQFPMLFSPFLY